MKLTRLLLFALLFPMATHAKTGVQLREACAAFDERPNSAGTSSNTMRMSECIACIHGVLDVPTLYIVDGANYRVPDGTRRGAALTVVREYIRRPEVAKMTWAGSGLQAVVNATMVKWPCKDTR